LLHHGLTPPSSPVTLSRVTFETIVSNIFLNHSALHLQDKTS
jgi:hypothetical protein